MNYSMSETNDSSWENGSFSLNSTTLEDREKPIFDAFNLNLSVLPIDCAALVLISLACLVNSFVLAALSKVSSENLQAKFLLTTNLLANVSFTVLQKVPATIIWMSMVFRLNNPLLNACLELVTHLVPPFGMLFQGFCSFCLACDRVYAVCFPLTYKIKGYSKLAKCVIVLCQILLALCLLLPAIILPLSIKRPPVDLCTRLIPGFFMYTRMLRPTMIIIQGLTTFLLYIFVFAYLKYKVNFNTKEKHSKASRKLSLTISYFLLYLTTMLLMSPVALYSFSLGVLKRLPSGNDRLILHLLTLLMLANSITDPILLINRIPEIKKRLPIRWKFFSKTSDGTTNTSVTKESASKSSYLSSGDNI